MNDQSFPGNVAIDYEEITPAKAIDYLQRTFERQRNLRKHTVDLYAQIMRKGTWEQNGMLRICVIDDVEYLVDGQHRLNAVVKAGIPQGFFVMRERTSQHAAERTYTTIDKNLVRKVSDDLRAMGVAEDFVLTSTQTNNLAAGVALIATGFRKVDQRSLHMDDRLTLMKDYLPAYRKYIQTTIGAERTMRRRLDRAATVAVAIVTFRYSILKHSMVPEFWAGVAFDDGVAANDPRKFCNRHLLFVGMTGGGASSANFVKHKSVAVSAREIAAYFNAYVEQRELKQSVKVYDPSKPIVIAGSPFDGSQ